MKKLFCKLKLTVLPLQARALPIKTAKQIFQKLHPARTQTATAMTTRRKQKRNTTLPLRTQRARLKMPLSKLRTVKLPLHFPTARP